MAFLKLETPEEDPKFEVVEEYATLGERTKKSGEKEYLRFQAVKWYGKGPVLDLRWWSSLGYAGKGVTFNEEAARNLYRTLKSLLKWEE